MAWVLEHPETRVRKLLRCLPKTLDEEDGGKLTKLFLEAFGDHENVAGSLTGHFFWSGGWIGPESAYRAGQRNKARSGSPRPDQGRFSRGLIDTSRP
jgi:hypothetical protein